MTSNRKTELLKQKTLSEHAHLPHMPGMLRHSILFETEVGRQWVETRFLALSLTFGAPHQHGQGNWYEFARRLEEALGANHESLSMTDVDEWLREYTAWYTREEHATQATEL